MIEVIEHPLPIFVIGDSHALPYRNFLGTERWTGNTVIVRAKYVNGLSGYGFYDSSTGELHPGVFDALEYEGLVRNGKATHLSKDEMDFVILQASGQPVTPPLLLFTVGDIDVRGPLFQMLRDTHDFVPPFDLPYPVAEKPLIPWDVLLAAYERSLSPLIAGLRELQAAGFNRIYVQSVVPPTQDEARSQRLHGYHCPLSVRTKLVATFNHLLKERCASIGVHCVSIWDDVTRGGYLRPEFELDGVHLAPPAARMHIEQLLDHAINHAWQSCNFVRHEIHYRQAVGLSPFEITLGDRP